MLPGERYEIEMAIPTTPQKDIYNWNKEKGQEHGLEHIPGQP